MTTDIKAIGERIRVARRLDLTPDEMAQQLSWKQAHTWLTNRERVTSQSHFSNGSKRSSTWIWPH